MQQATQTQTPDAAAQIRAEVRAQVDAARAQARAARDQARQAAQQAQQAAQQAEQAQPGVPAPPAPPGIPGANEIPQMPGTMPPFNIDPFIAGRVEHIAIEFFVMIVAIFFVVPIARAFARRIDKKPVATPLDHSLTEQLQRIENSVDSMAIEVERISEAQRYMARLQSDRSGSPALPSQQAAS